MPRSCAEGEHFWTALVPDAKGFHRECHVCSARMRVKRSSEVLLNEVHGTLQQYQSRIFRLLDTTQVFRFLGLSRHLCTMLHNWHSDYQFIFVPDTARQRPRRYFCGG
jgi:hypothetical protein